MKETMGQQNMKENKDNFFPLTGVQGIMGIYLGVGFECGGQSLSCCLLFITVDCTRA